MSGSAPAGAPSVDSRRGSVATFSTWLKSLKVKVSGSWAVRSLAVALSANRAVITGSVMVILIGVSSTSMTLRQILSGWNASQYTQPQRPLPPWGRDLLEGHERDGATQVPVRCSTASGLQYWARAGHNSPRTEPRTWQGF